MSITRDSPSALQLNRAGFAVTAPDSSVMWQPVYSACVFGSCLTDEFVCDKAQNRRIRVICRIVI